MKFTRLIQLALLLLLICPACSDNVSDPLTKAENALADNEFELAQTITDSLVSGNNFNKLSTTQLCRAALVYAKLSEQREPDANMAIAALCMRAASEHSIDSVEIFVQQLSVDDRAAIDMPRKLGNITGLEPILNEPIDSI